MENKMTTKEKRIFESLNLFSIYGYDGVSMREIAAAVGIKGASLYSHFKGKEDIFNGIFSEMIKQYDNAIVMMNIPIEENEQTIMAYHNADESRLLQMAEGVFDFFTQNEFTVMFRKLLITEQHKSFIAAKHFKEYIWSHLFCFKAKYLGVYKKTGIFKTMMQR
ncbi:MAG: TetR/AcrR family transcriptional regulator [Clostridium sp.]|uniref:TetR/AcrR family transcriptional regulator n=1 Tax=Clostridium sp. TaxID=1506 RepID=UPI002A8D5F74|nr:TetR/AcrR family transcriptional regulator [Clostridium sp.]MDY5098028.1 TetR/AcrR family transcriptional regulator [Clostridium sp.]